MHKFKREKAKINKMIDELKVEAGKIIANDVQTALFVKYMGQIENFFSQCNKCYTVEQIHKLSLINERYVSLSYWKSYKTKYINNLKDELLLILSESVEKNKLSSRKMIRRLRDEALNERNIISIFESSLTRMLGIETDELSTDIMVVKVYYFDIIQDLILNGFEYNGEKYMFLTASAGQIRTKKTVFIKESLWHTYERTLMCGLSVDEINSQGGINVNKYLAYLALSNSATDHWEDFDIDRCIVIPDFETTVQGTVDYINDKTYEVVRQAMGVPIEHTDGCGMILPTLSKKNFMVRLPWVKGLLASFDFVKFIEENGANPVIKDVYGKEHNIIDENIQIIFTKSQFKMWKYYVDWDDYKAYFKKYNCSAGTCKMEEDYIKPANINYQMLQTLTDITDEEIWEIAKPAITKLERMTSHIGVMLEAFGVDKHRDNMNYFQKALSIYPEMLADEYSKAKLNDIKNSMVNSYRAGKLPVKGKYTFVVPDLYAACEHWFMGIEQPNGLLKDGEVCCRLYNVDKVDCLRAPHLYREHAVRKNVLDDEICEWFNTDAIYTSSFDEISKILQFDNDGDTLLVVADKTIVDVAERNMKDIVPLYYDMKKAEPVILNNEEFYKGMTAAWTGGNIGMISNDITKIWNSSGDIGERELLAVKLLCMENNFVIDYAKTLYKPIRPEHADKLIRSYTKAKVPRFFIEAKGYEPRQVSPATDSLVNKLYRLIKKKRLIFKNVEPFSYKKLMHNPECTLTSEELTATYDKLSRTYHHRLNGEALDIGNIAYIIKDIKSQLMSFGMSEIDTVDILINHLYTKHTTGKLVLWACFGDVIYNNLKLHINPRETYCRKCGRRFVPVNNAHRYCEGCFNEKVKRPDERVVVCKDCGKTFIVKKSVRNKTRCDECQKAANAEAARLRKQRQREREADVTLLTS